MTERKPEIGDRVLVPSYGTVTEVAGTTVRVEIDNKAGAGYWAINTVTIQGPKSDAPGTVRKSDVDTFVMKVDGEGWRRATINQFSTLPFLRDDDVKDWKVVFRP